jgi:hypothetical protein
LCAWSKFCARGLSGSNLRRWDRGRL